MMGEFKPDKKWHGSMGASVFANMLKMYSYVTNYYVKWPKYTAETGFYIHKCI
jgi:hypothetical protein